MKKYFILISSVFFIFSCRNASNESEKEKADSISATKSEQSFMEHEMKEMTEKQLDKKPKENPYKDAKIDVLVFKNDTVNKETKYTGYGYAILVFGEQQVNQPHKPGMSGTNGFKTSADAKKTGEFVAYKMRNNIMPPSVSMHELDSLGVLK